MTAALKADFEADPQQLPTGFAENLNNPDQSVVLGAVSLWVSQGLRANGFSELPITAKQVIAVQCLPWIHRDPCVHGR